MVWAPPPLVADVPDVGSEGRIEVFRIQGKEMDGEVVAYLFDAKPATEAVPLAEVAVEFEGENLVDHRSEDQRLEMEEVALVGERPADLAGLLEGTELDFDAPPQGVDVIELSGGDGVTREIGDEQPPAIPQQSFLGGGRSTLARLPFAHAPVLRRVGGGQTGGDETAWEPGACVPADPDLQIDPVSAGCPEEVAQFGSVARGERDAGRQAADPERLAGFDPVQGGQIEEAHVAHDEITWAAMVEDLVGEGLVGVTGVVKLRGEHVAAEQIGEQEALAAGGGDTTVAVVGEVPGVAFGHRNAVESSIRTRWKGASSSRSKTVRDLSLRRPWKTPRRKELEAGEKRLCIPCRLMVSDSNDPSCMARWLSEASPFVTDRSKARRNPPALNFRELRMMSFDFLAMASRSDRLREKLAPNMPILPEPPPDQAFSGINHYTTL